MTATIMPASAASAIISVPASGTNGADGGAAEQPFGTLMEAVVQAAGGDAKGKTALEKGAVPVATPIAAHAASRLTPPVEPGKGVLPGKAVSVASSEEEGVVEPVEDRPAGMLPGEGEEPQPVTLAAEAQPEKSSPPPLPTTAPVAGEHMLATAPASPEVGKGAGEGEKAEPPKRSRDRSRTDGQAVAVLPDAASPSPAAMPQQAPSHPVVPAVMAVHLPRQQAAADTGGDAAPSLPDGSVERAAPSPQGKDVASDRHAAPALAEGMGTPSAPAAAATLRGDEGAASALVLTQSPMPVAIRGAGQIYGGALSAAAHEQPVVAAETGQMGHAMGVAIARGVEAGRDALFVRLDPAEMGRVHVRLSFDHEGAVHVAMSADSAVALDMLRREAGDLGRALNDAGVRADSQSFRFDGGGGNAHAFGQQRGGNGDGGQQLSGRPLPDDPNFAGTDLLPADPTAPYRGLRSAGGLNLII